MTATPEITAIIEDHDAWLAQRAKGIGGSDIAAICGLSPFQTAVDVWMTKTGRAAPKAETPAMHWGHNLEAVVADEYAKVTGFELRPGVHIASGCRVGNTDRMVPGAKRILEVKTASPYKANEWGEPGTDEIPEHYLTQVQWYLGLLPADEYEAADVPVLIGGNDFRIYHVERDDTLIAQLIEIGEAWWRAYVEADVPPEPDGSLDDMRARLALHPKDTGSMLDATPELDALARQLADARQALADAEAQKDALELQLKNLIGDASGISGAEWSCTWKRSKDSKATDWKEACARAGVTKDIIDACTSVKPGSRRFLFKPKFG